MRLVLDILGQDVEAIDFGGKPRRDGGAGLVAALGDLARGARGIGRDNRLDAELADDLAALAERVDVVLDRLDVFELGAFDAEQLVAAPA